MASKKSARRPARQAPKRFVIDKTRDRIARERKHPPVPERPAGRTLVPIQEAAQRLGLTVWGLRGWVYGGKIAFHRLGTRVMIANTEVERLIAATEVPATIT